jgi:hypothetical protein
MVSTSGYFGRLGGLILTLVGLAVLAAAVYSAIERNGFVHTAARVEGVVSVLNAGGSHPQVTFVIDGRTISLPQGGLIFGYRAGDKVHVLFNIADPAGTATLDALGAIWFVPLMLGGIGLVLLAAGITAWIRIRESG